MTVTQKPRVFLSSALKGLEDLRSIIIDFFKSEKGYIPIYYGDKCSGPLTGRPEIVELCLNGIRSSNAFILIIDRRYGKPNQKSEKGRPISLIELELLEATKHKIPTYVFCRREVWTIHKFWKDNPNMNFDAEPEYDYPKELMNFLTKLKDDGHYILRFHNAAELKDILSEIDLTVDLLKRQPSLIDEGQDLEVSS